MSEPFVEYLFFVVATPYVVVDVSLPVLLEVPVNVQSSLVEAVIVAVYVPGG